MCLSIELQYPDYVLRRGEHAGFQWIVTRNHYGYRCGYIHVPDGHPWYGVNADHRHIVVHDGITFSEPDVPCNREGEDRGWWIGFGPCLGIDAPDPSLPSRRRLDFQMPGIVRSTSFIVGWCIYVCDQAHALMMSEHAEENLICPMTYKSRF